MDDPFAIEKIIGKFAIDGKLSDIAPYGSGHINKTFVGTFQASNGKKHYIHQMINNNVFKNPEQVMDNVYWVTSYPRKQIINDGGNPLRETLTLVPTVDGKFYHCTEDGNYWRTYIFIEGARTYDKVENTGHVFHASKAFGKFQLMLDSYPRDILHETIPNFHNTPRRFQSLIDALEGDTGNRAKNAKSEIDFILNHNADVFLIHNLIDKNQIPIRITHNDTKLNNVMIDDITGQGVCVIDLDTVMPGCVLHDFGDSVRIGASTAAEDEADSNKVMLDINLFEALLKGYLDVANTFLTNEEKNHLAFSAKLMSLEQGIRFLTDYLNGDQYYKIFYPEHNLVRTRTQLKMVSEVERNMNFIEKLVDKYTHI